MPRFTFAQESDIRRIAATVLASERRLLNKLTTRSRKTPQTIECYIGKANVAIAARTATTPGSTADNVSLYKINSDGDLEDTGEDITAYNIAGGAVASGAYVMVKRDPFSGAWIVDFEDCG